MRIRAFIRSNIFGPYMNWVPQQLAVLATVLVMGLCAHAQDEDNLARDFQKLNAKERARIAKEEQEAAQNDAAYQSVMGDAELHFRELRFEESMAKFKEARALRPYNVYPKVKIKDLEVLIAKRDAEEAEKQVEQPPNPSSTVQLEPIGTGNPAVSSDPTEVVSDPAPVPLIVPKVPERAVFSSQETVPDPPVQHRTPAPFHVQKQPVADPLPPEAEGEKVYKEGRSVVVEVRLARNGRLVVYRKVTHPWGGIDHFRDGTSIPGHVYNEAMSGR